MWNIEICINANDWLKWCLKYTTILSYISRPCLGCIRSTDTQDISLSNNGKDMTTIIIFLVCFDWLITNWRLDDHRNSLADYHYLHQSLNASIVAGYHLECHFFSTLAIRRCNWFCLTGTREFPWIRLNKVLLSPLFTLSEVYVDFLPYVEGFLPSDLYG